jgi:anti-sigma factor RsiW
MNCRTLVELVTEYLEGVLPADEVAAIEGHLADCEACTTFLEQMRTTIRVTGSLHEDRIPVEVREPLLQAFRSWSSTR